MGEKGEIGVRGGEGEDFEVALFELLESEGAFDGGDRVRAGGTDEADFLGGSGGGFGFGYLGLHSFDLEFEELDLVLLGFDAGDQVLVSGRGEVGLGLVDFGELGGGLEVALGLLVIFQVLDGGV